MPSRISASVTFFASSGATVANSAPEAIKPKGSSPSASHIVWASGSVGIRAASISSPTPAPVANSSNAPAIPPSVGSCIAWTLAALVAISASRATLIPGANRKFFAFSMISLDTPATISSSEASRASMAAPSIGAPFVRIIESPTLAPEVITTLSLETSPSMDPTAMGLLRPYVTSV